jgi:DNA-binding response OmpR family regulator
MAADPSELGPNVLRGVHVVVVDDNTDARAIYKSVLTYVGASVLTASSASAAVKALKHVRPDVVVSDLSMPRRDGFWLIRWIRARDATRGDRLPVIAVTARDDIYPHADVGEAGFDDYLRKPVAPRDLLRAIKRLIGRSRSAERLA